MTLPAWLDRERLTVYPRIVLALEVVIGGWWVLSTGTLVDRGGKPIGGDFLTFWTAGRLVWGGEAAAAWSVARLHAEQQALIGPDVARFAWHYPPVALLPSALLALLPFPWALALWSAAGLAVVAVLVRRLGAGRLGGGLLWAFPGVFVNLSGGQNAFFTGGLLAGGLLLLDRAPVLAGVLLGTLGFKPHLVPAVAVALVAAGRWRTLGAAVATGLAWVAASVVVLGIGPWRAFAANLPFARAALVGGGLDLAKMPTTTAALLLAGVPAGPAQALQALVSVAALAAAAVGLRRGGPAGLAVVVVASLVVTPFAFDYDLALLLGPLAWLAPVALRSRIGLVTLSLAWSLPVLGTALAGSTGVQLGPWVLLALLGLGLFGRPG